MTVAYIKSHEERLLRETIFTLGQCSLQTKNPQSVITSANLSSKPSASAGLGFARPYDQSCDSFGIAAR